MSTHQQTEKTRSNTSIHTNKSKPQAGPHPAQILQRLESAPGSVRPADVKQLQRTIGNRATGRFLQAKLKLGPAGDQYEQEADRVAKEVVRASRKPDVQREERDEQSLQASRYASSMTDYQRSATPVAAGISRVQREFWARPKMPKVQRDEMEDELQASPNHGLEGGDVDTDVARSIQSAKGGGQPLHDGVRRSMESGFGADFGGVRVHTGGQADALNRSLNARAFTTGKDIFFGKGQYNPGSSGGQELIAHELTHTVQQGAAGVQRDVVQRLPSLQDVEKGAGKAKKKSTRYKPVLESVKNFHDRVGSARMAPSASTKLQQVEQITRWYDDIITACQRYTDRKDTKKLGFNKKRKYIEILLGLAIRERVAFQERGMEIARGTMQAENWTEVVAGLNTTNDLATPGRVNLQQGSLTGTVGGGINQLGIYTQERITGYFKQNQNQAPSEQEVNNLLEQSANQNLSNQQREEATKQYSAGNNLRYIAVESLGIDENDMRLEKRDLAMSRLDTLLGGNTIARTELGIKANGGQEGSIMAGAMGRKGGEANNYTGNDNGPQIDISDSGLQRHLSRLQIIDVLARQVDRNQGNFYLQTDQSGRVTGVTGIDNDMSFGGRQTDIDQTNRMPQEYPGISAYVDKEIALRVIRLNPDDIGYILNGLLPEAEVQQTIFRLGQLQDYLRVLLKEGKLLEPDQWTKATAKGLIKENKSYYGRLARGVLNIGKFDNQETVEQKLANL